MTPEQLMQIIPKLLFLAVIPAILYGIVRYIILEYRLHKNSSAPVCQDRAVAYFRHPEKDAPYLGRGYSYVYYITFHTDSGEAIKLYMTAKDYFGIQENDTGLLTWQGEKFWRFESGKKEE